LTSRSNNSNKSNTTVHWKIIYMCMTVRRCVTYVMAFVGLWPQGQIIVFWIVFSYPGHNIFVFRNRSMIIGMFYLNYLTLRSKVKVPRRSLRYVTHHLMVMHIRTIFQWTVMLDLFDLEVKGQGPTKVIMVRDTPPYGHAPTYQLSLTYLERQKCYGPDKKILFKKQDSSYVHMTISRCVAYRNDLCGTLTFDLKVK
jgi:hypothetical protein